MVNLTPHWFRVFLKYPHPPILTRIKEGPRGYSGARAGAKRSGRIDRSVEAGTANGRERSDGSQQMETEGNG